MRKITKRSWLLTISLAVLVIGLVLHKSVSSKNATSPAISTQIVTVSISGMGDKPWKSDTSSDLRGHFLDLVFGKLVEIDRGGKLQPGLILSWQYNFDRNSYTLTFDIDRYFHGYRKLSIEDAEYALIRMYLREVPDGEHYFYDNIKGLENLVREQPFHSGICPGVKVLNESQIEVLLVKKDPLFLYNFAQMEYFVAPIEDFDHRHHLKSQPLPRGTGPFRVTSSPPDSSAVDLERVVKRADGYVNFFRLHSGGPNTPAKSDIVIGAPAKYLVGSSNYQMEYTSFTTSLQVLDFNYSSPLGSDKRFRQAVSLALDRQEIFSDYPGATPAHELVAEGYFGKSHQKMEHSKRKARKIIDQELSDRLKSVKPLRGVYHGRLSAKKPRYIQRLEKQLVEIGIPVRFSPNPDVDLITHSSGVVFSVYGLATSFIDPASIFRLYVNPSWSMKHSTIVGDRVGMDLLRRADNQMDKKIKNRLLSELSAHFQKEFRTLPLASLRLLMAYNPSKVVAPVENGPLSFSLKSFCAR